MSIETVKSDLQSKVGTETHVGSWLKITQERIQQFADATGDHQWIHVDPERARKESPYGTTIAHGYLTLALLPFLTESVKADKPPYPGVKMGINYGLNRLRYPNAVPVGSRVRARTTLLAVDEVRGGLQLVNQVTVEIEGQEKPACVAETLTRLYF